MTIDYDPTDFTTGLGFLKVLCAWRNTVFPSVARSGLFWVTLLTHVGFQAMEHYLHHLGPHSEEDPSANDSGGTVDDGSSFSTEDTSIRRQLKPYLWTGLSASAPGRDGLPRVDWRVATVTLSLLVFFLVFYTITEHGRHNTFFMHCVGISGCVQEWAALVKLHLAPGGGTPVPACSSSGSGSPAPAAAADIANGRCDRRSGRAARRGASALERVPAGAGVDANHVLLNPQCRRRRSRVERHDPAGSLGE